MKDTQEKFDVIVVGGGASGMFAAGRAAERGKNVLLLEKNHDLGEKLKITGGGRCNITNAEFDVHKFLSVYDENAKFLYSPFSQFGVQETFDFFESRGLPLVIQARKRAFPKTERAFDVFRVIKKYVRKNKVTIRTGVQVTKILTNEKGIVGVMTSVGKFSCKGLVISTGGVSHPETGSTGDGFRWLAGLGHTVATPNPNIVPLRVREQWVKKLSGVSLSFMKITFYLDQQKAFSRTGKVLFTHFGLSGPLILNCSSNVKELIDQGQVTTTIDAFPDTNLGNLEKKIIKVFDANKNKQLKTVLKEIVPPGTASSLVHLLPVSDVSIKVHSVTKEDRKALARLLKALPVTITGLMGFDRAVISDGGVPLSEIDTKTMRSKLHKNLFITGDLLHVNRPSGGYSLQLCWTTGFVAGDNV